MVDGSTAPAWLARSGDGFRLGSYPLQPEGHVHLAVHRRRGGEVLAGVVPLAPALVENTETPVTVSDKGTHAPRFGEGQRLTVVGLGGVGVTALRMGRDVTEQVPGVGGEAGMPWRGFDGAMAQPSRLVHTTEQQRRPPQRMVGPGEVAHD